MQAALLAAKSAIAHTSKDEKPQGHQTSSSVKSVKGRPCSWLHARERTRALFPIPGGSGHLPGGGATYIDVVATHNRVDRAAARRPA